MKSLGSFIEKAVKAVGTVSKVSIEIGADLVGSIAEKIDDNPESKEKFSDFGKTMGQSIRKKTNEFAQSSAKAVNNVAEYGSKVYQNINNNMKELNIAPSKTDNFSVTCPYCQQSIVINSEGDWKCPLCNNHFSYRDSIIALSEDVCSEGVRSFVAILAKIAKIDGVVTEKEVTLFKNILINEVKLNKNQIKNAGTIFNKEKQNPYEYEEFLLKCYQLNEDNKEILLYILDAMFRIAIEDDGMDTNQEKMILRALSIFDLTISDYNDLKQSYTEEPEIENTYNNDLDSYYTLLNCTRNCSNEELQKKYRKLMFTYHPDKYVSKDLPSEMMNLAKEKTQAIQEAYEIIKTARGF